MPKVRSTREIVSAVGTIRNIDLRIVPRDVRRDLQVVQERLTDVVLAMGLDLE